MLAALLVYMGALCDSGGTGPASASIPQFCSSDRTRISSGAAPLCLALPAVAGCGRTLGLRGGRTDIDALLQSLYTQHQQQLQDEEDEPSNEQDEQSNEVTENRHEREETTPQRDRVWDKDEEDDEDAHLLPDTLTSTTQFRGAREKGRRFLNLKTLQVDSSSLHPSTPPCLCAASRNISQQNF
ncbi:hypothetical protein T484DRAFT_1747488 [Baffinella frigidus]|nr:hypothetical protein T484DRAFT_1747488 [Cryptophyta sp. CCMP2293]